MQKIILCDFDAAHKLRALEAFDDVNSARARAQDLLNSGAETSLAILRANIDGEQVNLSAYTFIDYLQG